MTVDKNFTPLPQQRIAPVQVEVADWLDLPANSSERILRERGVGRQSVNINRIGGRPETDVDIEVSALVDTNRGQANDEEVVESSALNSFGNFVEAGPIATQAIRWEINNRSGTNHTQAQAGENPYQTFINYTVQHLPVIEKIRRRIPLTGEEERVAEKFNLFKKERLGVPERVDDTLRPNMDGKVVADRETVTKTLDITETGASQSVSVVTEQGLQDRGLVAYATGLKINSEDYTFGDSLAVSFTRNGTNEFYRLDTKGIPGFASDYKADLHIPFINRMDVEVFASNAINNVDVQVEYALVQRTLLEKALYGLNDEIIKGDDMDQNRREVFDKLADRLTAGTSVQEVLEGIQFAPEATA